MARLGPTDRPFGTGPGVLLAETCGAGAAEVDVVVVDLEPLAADVGQRDSIQQRVLQVNDLLTLEADQVVIL